MRFRVFRRVMTPALVVLGIAGCKDATVGPTLQGAITGRVLDYDTGQPIAGASVSTTPASAVLVTDADGAFRLDDLDVGTYQVAARKAGYEASSVGVAVREASTTSATVFLEKQPADSTMLDASVLSFWNTQVGDSTFAEAEYRVRNIGTKVLDAYEIFFRIDAPGGPYYQDEQGDTLAAGQMHIRRFRTFIPTGPATAVKVDTVWTGSSTAS